MNTTGTQASPDIRETEITLGLLSAVDADAKVTQRKVASELGIALGLANAYLRRCIRKGWVKVHEVPSKRYAYYLTPKGFAEKSRLTAEYLSQSLKFFRIAREQCAAMVADCQLRGWERVALWGAGDLAEIAVLCAAEKSLPLVAVVAAGTDQVAGVVAVADPAVLGPLDGVIVTDYRDAVAAFDRASALVGADRVLCPPLLGMGRAP